MSRKVIIAIVLVAILIALSYRDDVSDRIREGVFRLAPTDQPASIEDELPEGWTEVEPASTVVDRKYEKTTENSIYSSVVFISSEYEGESAQEHTDDLIKGTQSALPSLTIEEDSESEEAELYTRTIVGYYFNGSDRINIRQQISIKDNFVYTITSSSDPLDAETVDSEIKDIFNIIQRAYIL